MNGQEVAQSVIAQVITPQMPGARIILELDLKDCGRIDIAAIHEGKLHGFEIKTDADSFKRLPGQMEAYSKVCHTCTLVHHRRHIRNDQMWDAIKGSCWRTINYDVVDGHCRFISGWADILWRPDDVWNKPTENWHGDPLAMANCLHRHQLLTILRGLPCWKPAMSSWSIGFLAREVAAQIPVYELRDMLVPLLVKRYEDNATWREMSR
jgi:hypothetical protein